MNPPGDWGTWLNWGPTFLEGLVILVGVLVAESLRRRYESWRQIEDACQQLAHNAMRISIPSASPEARRDAGYRLFDALSRLERGNRDMPKELAEAIETFRENVAAELGKIPSGHNPRLDPGAVAAVMRAVKRKRWWRRSGG